MKYFFTCFWLVLSCSVSVQKTQNLKKHFKNPGFSSSETNVTTSPKNNFESWGATTCKILQRLCYQNQRINSNQIVYVDKKTINYFSWVVWIYFHQIQDGERHRRNSARWYWYKLAVFNSASRAYVRTAWHGLAQRCASWRSRWYWSAVQANKK